MRSYQDIANDIGASIRAAEATAAGSPATLAHLQELHEHLSDAFVAVNQLGADLDWNQAAGTTAARGDDPAGNDPQESGGGNKGEPTRIRE